MDLFGGGDDGRRDPRNSKEPTVFLWQRSNGWWDSSGPDAEDWFEGRDRDAISETVAKSGLPEDTVVQFEEADGRTHLATVRALKNQYARDRSPRGPNDWDTPPKGGKSGRNFNWRNWL